LDRSALSKNSQCVYSEICSAPCKQTHAETQINNDHEFPEAGQQQISGRRDPVCF